MSAPNSLRSRIGNTVLLALLAGLALWLLQLQSSPWPTLVQHSMPRLLALVACTLWLLLCFCIWKPWAKKSASSSTADADWHVIHASQTGTALELANRTVEALQASGARVALHDIASLHPKDLVAWRCLLIASTTGEGDPPDPALGFAAQWAAIPLDLRRSQYAILALGDRSYTQFCAFGHQLDTWLRAAGAQPLFDLVEVDNADPGALRHWQHQLGVLTGHTDHADWAAPQYQQWTLTARHLLNPGSAGGPAYHLELTPAGGETPHWQAGDIAEIGPRDTQGELLPHREYSIASIPADGRLHLLVRLMQREDGSPGLASGWLCQRAAIGAAIDLRIRSNPNFHAPAPARPLILIGNGTGLAGLRAHLKARIAIGATQNWLLFGERHAAHDALYGEELDAWRDTGQLQQLDRVYSRDGHSQRYVQDTLRSQAALLQQWLDNGAALYVCGSLQGMAPGVDAVLRELLGDAAVSALQQSGRYRRDVY